MPSGANGGDDASVRSYESISEPSPEETRALMFSSGASSQGIFSVTVFAIQLVLASVHIVFFGASASTADLARPGLVTSAMAASSSIIVVTPALGVAAWRLKRSASDGSSHAVSTERKFQHLLLALSYGLSIVLLLFVDKDQVRTVSIACTVFATTSAIAHLLYAVFLFVKRT